jgi:5,6-dimethylbenzimidazole synthase
MIPGALSAANRDAVYEVIAKRRDIRIFRSDVDVPPQVLTRILSAAHQAPSVGYSQPWDFILVRNIAARSRIRDSFLACREAEAGRYPPQRRRKYLAYRLEGILESALDICVTVDLRPADELVLGTGTQPETLRSNACCAARGARRGHRRRMGSASSSPRSSAASLVSPMGSSRWPICALDTRSSFLNVRCWTRPSGARASRSSRRYTPSVT